MRFLAVSAAVCVLACNGLTQTTSELEAKFGRFDGKGFDVAPDLTLTVTYGDDHNACQLRLRSKKSVGTRGVQPRFEADVADRILNETAPLAACKGLPRTITVQSGCSVITTDTYDNVGIGRVTSECLPLSKKNVRRLEINWKRPACE
jgi:hypothetical protein